MHRSEDIPVSPILLNSQVRSIMSLPCLVHVTNLPPLSTIILYSPDILLHMQETTRFCLAKSNRSRYSQAIHVNTVGKDTLFLSWYCTGFERVSLC